VKYFALKEGRRAEPLPAPAEHEDVQRAEIGQDEAASTKRLPLGRLLVEAGVASDEQVKSALEEGLKTGERLGEVVVRKGWATDERIASLLADQWHLRFLRTDALVIDPTALRTIPVALARELDAIPIGFDVDGVLVAIAEPAEKMFEAVREQIGDASFAVVARSALDRLLTSRMLVDAPTHDDAPAATDLIDDEFRAGDEDAAVRDADPDNDGTVAAEEAMASAELPQVVDLGAARSQPVERAPAGGVADAKSDRRDQVGALEHASGTGAGVEAALDALETATQALELIRQDFTTLASSLELSQAQLARRDAELAAAEAAQERDADTIKRLESELSRRGDLVKNLKAQFDRLSETFDEASTS
jgi:MshEN domain